MSAAPDPLVPHAVEAGEPAGDAVGAGAATLNVTQLLVLLDDAVRSAGLVELWVSGTVTGLRPGPRFTTLELVDYEADGSTVQSVLSVGMFALHEALDRIEARIEAGAGDIIGVPLGYRDVDDALLGLQPQGLYVVAAAPGHCKTSFVLGAATHVAMTMRRPVVFFSLEMSRAALTQRILAAQARVDSRRLRTGKLLDTDWPKVTSAIGRLQGSPLVIDETSICTLLHMRARCRRVRARHGDLGLVVVDYLQLMTSTGRAENRQVEVAQFSRGLKLLAKDLDVPVLVAAQINRNVDQRQDKRPGLSDLRESGAIEADSDAVLCLYRDELYNPDSKEKGQVEVLIRKHREGETRSDIRLAFLGQYSTLASMAHV